MRTLIFILLLFISIHKDVYSQVGGCKQKILKYYNELEKKIQLNTKKTFYAEMVYTSYVDEMIKPGIIKPKTIENTIKMHVHQERSCFENNDMILFRDDKDLFAILKADRIILRSKITNEQLEQQFMLTSLFKDSIFITSEIISCRKAGGVYAGDVLEIKMLLSEKYQQIVKANEITLYFDDKQQRMLALEISFLEGYKIQRQIIKYKRQEFVSDDLLSRPVRTNFLDKNGKLLRKYAGYRYMDSSKE